VSDPGRTPPRRRSGEIGFGTRRTIFLVAAAGLGALLVWGLAGLPDFGDYDGVYGLTLNRVAVGERHATDLVTAINFDYRAFDTLGEEFILFVRRARSGAAAARGARRGARSARRRRSRPPRARDERRRARHHPGPGRADRPPVDLHHRARPAHSGRRLPGRRHRGDRAAADLPRRRVRDARPRAAAAARRGRQGGGRGGIRPDRPRRSDRRGLVSGELPSAGHDRRAPLRRHDPAAERGRRARGDRRDGRCCCRSSSTRRLWFRRQRGAAE
jgi:hypothetical protein